MEEMIAYAEGRHRTYFSNLQDAKRMVAKLGDDSEPLVPGQRSLLSSRSHTEKKIKEVDVEEMFLSLKKEVDE